MRENNKTDVKVNDILSVKNKNGGFGTKKGLTYTSLAVKVVRNLNNSISPKVTSKNKFQQEDLNKAIDDVSSSAKQYLGKREEEIEKIREAYRDGQFEDSNYF